MSRELYEKACQIQSHGNPFNFLYRNMSSSTYDTVMYNQNGLMRTNWKDHSGDSNCPINGQLRGIFFCANVDNETLQPKVPSPYGNTRLSIPVEYFLEHDVNLYFADFFCLKPRASHKVVLVMTPDGSDADLFCIRNGLIQLDLDDENGNPFLFRELGLMFVHSRIYVEIFWTEDINVHELLYQHDAQVTMTPVYNTGTTWVNLPKYPYCPTCNPQLSQRGRRGRGRRGRYSVHH